MIVRTFALLWLAMTLACAPPVDAAERSTLPHTRFPFSPRLLVDRNPPLCAKALRDAQDRFRSHMADVPVPEIDGDGVVWLDWKPLDVPANAAGRYHTLEIDLDGRGTPRVLVYVAAAHNWQGDNHVAYDVGTRADLQRLVAGEDGIPGALRRAHAAVMANAGRQDGLAQQMYYPDAQVVGAPTNSARVSTGDVWQPHRLFRWRDAYYFYDTSNYWGRMRQQVLTLYRLRAGGAVDAQCRVQVMPDDAHNARFRAMSGMNSFLTSIAAIGSSGSGDCGTLNAGGRHEGQADASVFRASFRPWAVSRALPDRPYFHYDVATQALMEFWSYREIWNRREYQTFLHHVEPAVQSMERFLRVEFGVPAKDAAREARSTIETIIAAHLLVPRDFQDNWERYLHRQTTRRAVLSFDRTALLRLFSVDEHRASDPPINDAVEWPGGLEILLDRRADPNHPEDGEFGFGKTPLMSAAHMNRPDAVRLLLLREARPNVTTVPSVFRCGMVIERGSRTALMYAAENAGPEVMGLLLDGGADATARDSKGNGVDFYLRMNPRLTVAEKRMSIADYVAAKRPFTSKPSFDCGAASGRVERKICDDEILAMMDRELAVAFERLKGRLGAAAIDDQRRWLALRDSSCRYPDAERELGCLQQELRARVRYLHNRLAEPDVSSVFGKP